MAQRPITLVLMMINHVVIVLMILCLFSLRYVIKILVGVYLQQRISSQVLEVAHVDSRACTSRPHQVLKRSLALGSRFGPSQEGEEDFQVKTFKRRLVSRFVFRKILFLDKM